MAIQNLLTTVLCFGLLSVCSAVPRLSERDNFSAQDTITVDVCIIGGGATGTYAAVRLQEDYGKSVIVVEKTDRLGGHTETYFATEAPSPYTGAPVDYGVQAWIASDLTTNFFGRFDVALSPVPSISPFTTEYIDFKTGAPIPGYTPPTQAEIGAAVQTYLGVLSQWPTLATGAFVLPNPIPEDLLLPFRKFVTKYNLQAILPLIFQFAQSVGDLLEATTLYVVQTAGLPIIEAALQQGFVAPTNGVNIEVYLKAAEALGSSVLYKSTVDSVDRHDIGLQQIIVKTPNGKKLVKAKKILVTIPPTLDNLDPFHLDNHEESLFRQWMWTTYFCGVVQGGVPDDVSLVNTQTGTTDNIPIPPFIQNMDFSGIPDLHTFHAVYLKPATTTDVSNLVISELTKMSSVGTFSNVAPPVVEVISSHTPILLRVSADAVKNGFYTDLYALQERHGTFWTGQAWASDFSTLLWGYTEGVLAQLVPLL
jgi:hypothetical protein